MAQILTEQEKIRRQSLNELMELGIDPYPAEAFDVNVTAEEIHKNYPEKSFENVSIAGRIMSRRIMGAASFVEIQDSTGRIQCYLKRDNLCPGEDKTLYNKVFKQLLDIGDIIGIKGKVFTTKMGETTIQASELVLLAKSLKPLPVVKEKDDKVYDAFSDPEQRYRQRYVDLIVNPQVKITFLQRTKMINFIR